METTKSVVPGVSAPGRWDRWKPWFMPLMLILMTLGSLFAPDVVVFAHQTSSTTPPPPIPTVQYGTGTGTGAGGAFISTVTNAMENGAETIRMVLGGTALLVILVAAVMNHFVHDQRAKERAKELIAAAVVGLLLAAFAPSIVNFIASV